LPALRTTFFRLFSRSSLTTIRTGFTEILAWITSAQDFTGAGARAHSLATVLNPIDSRFRNLSAISRASGVHRATLNKSLHNLLDTHGVQLCVGKLQGSREKYRAAQLAAVAAGTHASNFTRKNHRAAAPETEKPMNADQPKTLDAAKQRIKELEAQLAGRGGNQTGKTTTKPAAATGPQLADLSDLELKEALDLAAHSKDAEMTKIIYSEVCRRRN
jgi:hypothetical protein